MGIRGFDQPFSWRAHEVVHLLEYEVPGTKLSIEVVALSHGEPDYCLLRVRSAAESAARPATTGKNGSLIVVPTLCVQLDKLLENFWALVKTASGSHAEV